MSDFKQIINYLKFFRRSEDAALNNKYKEAIIVDESYKHKEIPHEDDFIFVEKKAVESQNGYIYLGHEIEDTLYLQQQSNGIIEYYIKKDFQIDNETITKYRRIPLYFNDSWEEKEGVEFVEIETPGNYYYSQAIDRIVEISLDSVFVFPDYFVYHPNDLQDITNGDYSFNYKDEEGYTSDYSDLALRALLSTGYNLVSSETKRNVGFHKNDKAGFVFLLPKISQRGGKYYLEYTYYQKGISYNSFMTETAIRLEFNYFGALLEFLNQTVFYGLEGLDAFNSNAKKLFLEDYTVFVENLLHFSSGTKILETLYFVPIFFFKKIDPNFLWYVLEKTLEYSVTNIGLNKEDIVLRILEGIYEGSKSDTIFLQEVVNKRTKSKKSLLHELIHSIDGDNFKKMLQFLWNIWKNSDFSTIDPEKNKFIDITDKNPVLIDYRSTKKLGFHTDNTAIEWKLSSNSIALKVVSGTGIYKEITVRTADGNDIRFVEEKITHDYDYHPLSPLAIIEADNPTFILKDEEQQEDSKFTILPAFVLYANNESAFWENIMTGGEYAIDVLTTLSGVGNILKVGRLAKILKAGHSLIGKSKAVTNVITGVKAFAGVVEISSGVGNALLKLLDVNDTELGREIAEYLFYLEMISLSGEITVALHVGLKKNAKKLVGNAKNKAKLEKKLDDLVDQKQISKSEANEVIEHLKIVANEIEKISYVPLRFDKLYSISAAALDTALNVSKNIFFYLKNLTKANTETVFYKGVEIFTDSPAKVKVFLDDAAKVLNAKGNKGVEQFFESTGYVLPKKRLHSQTGETFICNLVRKKEMNKYYYYEIEDFQYGVKNWNRKQTLRSERFECFVTLADKPSIPETIGKNILYADLYVPKSLNDTFQANKLDLTDISLGKTMLDDGYAILKKDLGKDLDGIYGEWLNNPGYKDFGGESVNLTKLKEAMSKQKITKENLEIAAMETVTGKWAKSKGFTKAMVVSKSNVYEFLDDDINRLKQLEVIFIK